jgi:hypothetical protein
METQFGKKIHKHNQSLSPLGLKSTPINLPPFLEKGSNKEDKPILTTQIKNQTTNTFITKFKRHPSKETIERPRL